MSDKNQAKTPVDELISEALKDKTIVSLTYSISLDL
jgi:hypothetical protein